MATLQLTVQLFRFMDAFQQMQVTLIYEFSQFQMTKQNKTKARLQ